MWKTTHPTGWLPGCRRSLSSALVVLSAALPVSAVADAGPAAGELSARWTGRWVVITSEVRSGCADSYTNNRVRAGEVRTDSGGWERKLQRFGRFVAQHTVPDAELPGVLADLRELEAGELGTVHRVKVTGDRIDLLVDLEGRFLLPYEHGAFTLYREAHCKVQLQFEVPKKVVKRGSLAELEGVLGATVRRFGSEAEARGSNDWNGRGDDPYPSGYEDTLRAYTRWRNDEIDRTLGDALALAAEIGANLPSSGAYFDGFYRGVNDIEPVLDRRSCEKLVGESFEAMRQRPGMGEVATKTRVVADLTFHYEDGETDTLVVFDRRGYEDGQRLMYALAMLRKLPDCRLPEEGGT